MCCETVRPATPGSREAKSRYTGGAPPSAGHGEAPRHTFSPSRTRPVSAGPVASYSASPRPPAPRSRVRLARPIAQSCPRLPRPPPRSAAASHGRWAFGSEHRREQGDEQIVLPLIAEQPMKDDVVARQVLFRHAPPFGSDPGAVALWSVFCHPLSDFSLRDCANRFRARAAGIHHGAHFVPSRPSRGDPSRRALPPSRPSRRSASG